VVTDENDNVVQTLDYYPYGSTRISVATSTNEKRKFIGQFTDDSTLSYLNSRYYNSTQGQFLSQDSVFQSLGNPNQVQQLTGENTQTYLSDPQQFNSYGYSRDNPIINKDPSGNAFGVDDAAGFLAGGLVGTGAFITTGLIGGFYGNLTKQEIDIAAKKQQGGINFNDLNISALTTAGTNGILQIGLPNARIPGYSSGQGNMYATGQGMLTRGANGTISNVSVSTGVKSAIGSQAVDLYRTLVGILTQIVVTLSQNSTQASKK
jgi:RHS repeat-associated protein